MRKQRGSIEIIVGVIVLTLVVTIGGLALHAYNRAIERAQTAESEIRVARMALSDQLAENARIKGAQEATDKINAARKGSDIKKADIERMIRDGIQGVYAKSPGARAWSTVPVPADVLASVRNPTAGGGNSQDGARPAAGPVDGRNAGAGAAGGADKRPVTRFRAPDSLSPPKLQ